MEVFFLPEGVGIQCQGDRILIPYDRVELVKGRVHISYDLVDVKK